MREIFLPGIRKFYGYLKKDFLLLVRRRKYLYLFILLPLIIAGLFLFALNPSDYEVNVGVCDFDSSAVSAQAFSNLKGFKPIFLEKENCIDNMVSMIKSGEISLGMEIGEGFSRSLQDLEQSKIVVYYDNTDIAFANLISWKVDLSLAPFERGIIDSLNSQIKDRVSSARSGVEFVLEFNSISGRLNEKIGEIDSELESLESINTEFLVNPIWTDQRPIYNAELQKSSGIAFIFPILALFVILMLSSTSFIYDKKTGFLTRVKSSTSPLIYLFAKIVFFSVLVLVQFLIILLLFMMYGSSYSFSLLNLLELIVFVAIFNSLFGIIIGLISNNEGIAVLFSLIISFPLMLISGIFFPIQTLPKIVQYIGKILPLNYQIITSKAVLLFNQGISNTWIYFAVGLFFVVYWLIKKDKFS